MVVSDPSEHDIFLSSLFYSTFKNPTSRKFVTFWPVPWLPASSNSVLSRFRVFSGQAGGELCKRRSQLDTARWSSCLDAVSFSPTDSCWRKARPTMQETNPSSGNQRALAWNEQVRPSQMDLLLTGVTANWLGPAFLQVGRKSDGPSANEPTVQTSCTLHTLKLLNCSEQEKALAAAVSTSTFVQSFQSALSRRRDRVCTF